MTCLCVEWFVLHIHTLITEVIINQYLIYKKLTIQLFNNSPLGPCDWTAIIASSLRYFLISDRKSAICWSYINNTIIFKNDWLFSAVNNSIEIGEWMKITLNSIKQYYYYIIIIKQELKV